MVFRIVILRIFFSRNYCFKYQKIFYIYNEFFDSKIQHYITIFFSENNNFFLLFYFYRYR